MSKGKTDPILVTKPFLPDIEDYFGALNAIWQRAQFSNNGPCLKMFEAELCKALRLDNLVAVNNATTALQLAIKSLNIEGEIITTPFTWIATLSSIKWQGCEPVFCDINPETLNIDVDKIEAKITSRTSAIMPVHVFGNPCDVRKIDALAKRYDLRVIYDAAHAVGSKFDDESVLSWGDISVVSFHATKLLHCAEGGGCVTSSFEIKQQLEYLRNFGLNPDREIVSTGCNAKLSELHAALGLVNLKDFRQVIGDRKRKYEIYREAFANTKRIRLQVLNGLGSNCSYFPIICESEELLLKIKNKLEEEQIFARRYFHPSLSTLPEYNISEQTPNATSIANRILCLPLYYDLSSSDIERIIDHVTHASW